MRILLASGSPRRRALLKDLGWEFEVCSPDVDESHLPNERPEALCERLSRLKAKAVTGVDDATLVIAADTIVVVDGKVLGKPADREDARRMLGLLQGRAHEVMTGVALRRGGQLLSGLERTAVHFRPLSEDEIAAYAATGEGDDKAGAYAIQGRGALLIASIEGDYFNVVGLPLCRLGRMLEELGLTLKSLLQWEETE
ncbi:MAG: septum formation inhibitor Maf [Synergistaceae bacterium]|nr:septum formation inhibitor Maf [Synergistaceae bacterium]